MASIGAVLSARPASGAVPDTGRVDWVDVAKGFCIIFVVMMHSTLGVEAAAGAEGWMGWVVAFAQPFRMPDFFLIAGLFLYTRIDHPWRNYFDKKVLHFAYFYVLWVTIQFAFKAPGFLGDYGAVETAKLYALAFVQPFGTLWFIYLLPIFFVVCKLLRNVPWVLVFAVGCALEIAPIHTGLVLIDEFASRFVYFYAGFALAPFFFSLARSATAKPATAGAMLAAWAVANGVLVADGAAGWPVVSLLLGFAGGAAVVAFSALIASALAGDVLRYIGQRSIVVYLSFFLPMAITRIVLLKLGVVTDVGTISLIVTAVGVIGPLVFYAVIQRFGILGFLYERPAWARVTETVPPQRLATI